MSGCKTESETEQEQEQSNTSILLPIFKFNPQTTMVDYSYSSSSPERSGIVTPPFCTLASVPFGWEEEPGKPRITSSSSNTNAIVTLTKSKSKSKSLQLPPRLQQLVHDEGDDDATKVHSPSSVLEGPYCISRSNTCHLPPSSRGLDTGMRTKERGWFGSLRGWKGFNVKREVSRGSYVFSSNSTSSADEDYHVNENKVRSVTKMQRSRSISHLFHAKPWTMIRESFKQVVPWKSQKLKEVGYGALNL
ncbi:hypothetical protein S245_018633 [Arachis hypogaea]